MRSMRHPGVAAAIVSLLLVSLVAAWAWGRDSDAGARRRAAEVAYQWRGSLAIGAGFHGMWQDWSWAQRLKVLNKLARAGVRWIRLDLSWCSLQQNGPRDHQSWFVNRADRIVDEARARGIKVLGLVYCTPPWAVGLRPGRWSKASPMPPRDNGDFGRVTRWLAAHFRGRIRAWEIWNEPNLDEFWTGSASEYVDLLKVAYRRIKSVAPRAAVVAGGIDYNDTSWLRSLYERGARRFFDVLAVHPYPSPGDLPPEAGGTMWTVTALPTMRNVMRNSGDREKPIWITELGWSSHANTSATPNWARGVTKARQAAYLERAIRMIRDSYPYVRKLFWYTARNRVDSNVHNNNFGLLEYDLSKKPAYRALKRLLERSAL
jgi:polysaccharide biosynthesis protein PslG